MSLTNYVADFARTLGYDDIPEGVRQTAIEHILDGYGLALGGHVEEGHEIIRRYAERVGCSGEVTVLGTPFRSSTHWLTAVPCMRWTTTTRSSRPTRAASMVS
jgi:2-methylcitrate dehydratase PrpD